MRSKVFDPRRACSSRLRGGSVVGMAYLVEFQMSPDLALSTVARGLLILPSGFVAKNRRNDSTTSLSGISPSLGGPANMPPGPHRAASRSARISLSGLRPILGRLDRG